MSVEQAKVKKLIEEVFDTTNDQWTRKVCGRAKCRELIEALEKYMYMKKCFGDSERCEIPDACIKNIKQVYKQLIED